MNDGGWGPIIVLVFIGLCVVGVWNWLFGPEITVLQPNYIRQTRELCEQEAKRYQKDESSIASDHWGNGLRYDKVKHPKCIIVKVTSNGPDGIEGTGDDITGENTNFNKSRIIGEWAGKKAREGAKGLFDGLRTKSEFEKE